MHVPLMLASVQILSKLMLASLQTRNQPPEVLKNKLHLVNLVAPSEDSVQPTCMPSACRCAPPACRLHGAAPPAPTVDTAHPTCMPPACRLHPRHPSAVDTARPTLACMPTAHRPAPTVDPAPSHLRLYAVAPHADHAPVDTACPVLDTPACRPQANCRLHTAARLVPAVDAACHICMPN